MVDEIWAPDVDVLIAELKELREKGLGELRRLTLPQLERSASVAQGTSGEVETLLVDAIEQIGGDAQTAAEHDFGILKGEKLWSSYQRRSAAAMVYGISVGRFRKEPELRILEQIAINIRRRVLDSQDYSEPNGDQVLSRQHAGVPTGGHIPIPPSRRLFRILRELRPRPLFSFLVSALSVALGFGGTLVFTTNIINSANNQGQIVAGTGNSVSGDSYTNNYWPEGTGPSEDDQPYEGGWGPERRMFEIAHPAPYPAFNSIIDNPTYGDERNFVSIRRMEGTEEKVYTDNVHVQPGDQLDLDIYVENAAAPNYEAPTGSIQGARLLVNSNLHETWAVLWAQLSADNCKTVWDGVKLESDVPIDVFIDSATSMLYNSATSEESGGIRLGPDLLRNEGALIGSIEDDGNINSADGESGLYVRVRVHVNAK